MSREFSQSFLFVVCAFLPCGCSDSKTDRKPKVDIVYDSAENAVWVDSGLVNELQPHVDVNDFRRIAQFNHAKKVSLVRVTIEPKGLHELSQLIEVRELVLQGVNLPDETLQYLSELSSLETLNILGTNVGGKYVNELGKLTQLRRLFIRGTQISESQARELKTTNPRLEYIDILDSNN